MKANENKKFVIGIGSQRAGSTLLHKLLDECTDVFMHPVKELHYYDTIYDVRGKDVLKKYSKKQLDREVEKIFSSSSHKFIDKKYRCYLRANWLLSKKNLTEIDYIDLYRPCLMDNQCLGEITPEYMILPDVAVSRMAEELGSDSKIILLTRDPIDRFISAYKLLKIYNDASFLDKDYSLGINDVLDNMPKWVEHQKELSDYHAAEVKYKKFFNDVLVISYEDFVSNPIVTAKKIALFIEEDLKSDKLSDVFKEKVNSIGETGKVDEATMSRLSLIFRMNP